MPEARPRILYLSGMGRSGSTLFDNILDQLDGVFTAGELHFIWDRAVRDNRRCACGEAFDSCPVWRDVMARFALSGEAVDPDVMASVRESVGPARAVLARLRGRPAAGEPDLAAYVDAMARLYRAIHEVTGCRVIVDSSKSPALGWLVESVPGFEFQTAHIVRDARATSYAWTKRKVYDDAGESPMMMSEIPPGRSAVQWLKWNLAVEYLWRRRETGYLRLRYEDFVAEPRPAVESVARLALDAPPTALPFSGPRELDLRTNHSVAGNPSRFKTGRIEVRLDDAWRQKIPARDRRLVTAITWPMLLRYGYRL